ncbi:cupin domain-containing protein [Desulfocurvus sp. DL9XJH121]
MGKEIITLSDILKAAEAGQTSIPGSGDGVVITAQARDKAAELGISLPGVPAPVGAEACVSETRLVDEVCSLLAERGAGNVSPEELRRVVSEVTVARLGRPAGLGPGRGQGLGAGLGLGQGMGLAPGRGAAAAQASQGGPGQYTAAGGVYQVEFARLFKDGSDQAVAEGRVLVAEAVNCDCADLNGACMEWENASLPRTLERPEIAVVIDGELRLTTEGRTLVGKPGDMFYLSAGSQVEYEAPGKVRLACVSVK